MSDTAWLAIATFAAAVLGFIGCLLTLRKDRRAIRDTRDELSQTRNAVTEIHEKVGNGFAQQVIDSLGEVNSGIDALRIQVGIANARISNHVKQHQAGAFAPKRKS